MVLPALVMPDPLLPIAIAPKSRGDEEKLSSGWPGPRPRT